MQLDWLRIILGRNLHICWELFVSGKIIGKWQGNTQNKVDHTSIDNKNNHS